MSNEFSPVQNASYGLAHILVGLMKEDGPYSQENKKKAYILVNKMRFGLPGDHELVEADMDEIFADPRFAGFTPVKHLETAFSFFDEYVHAGAATPEQIQAVIDLVEVMMEIDGVSEGELVYLNKLETEFAIRYNPKTS